MSDSCFKFFRISLAVLVAGVILATGLYLLKDRLGAGAIYYGGSFREVILPGAGERFNPYVKGVPEEQWGGCALSNVQAGPYKYQFNFKCTGGADFIVRLDPAFASEGYKPEAEGDLAAQDVELLVGNLVTLVKKLSDPGPASFEKMDPWSSLPIFIVIFIVIYFAVSGWWKITGMFAERRRGVAGEPIRGGGYKVRVIAWHVAPLLLILIAGAMVRIILTRPGLSEVVSFFQSGPTPAGFDKHSVLYHQIKGLLQSLGVDPLLGLIRFNEIAGILTIIPLYIFVLRRSGDRLAAVLTAVFFAVHPVMARMSATDAHHPLLMLFWCSGMALLSGRAPGGLAVFGGFTLLGMASVMRIEGIIYFASAIVVLWPDALKAAWRRRISLIAGLLVVAAMIVNQYQSRMHAWGFEFFFLRETMGGPSKFWSAVVNLSGFLAHSQKPLGVFWPVSTALALAGCIRAVTDRRQRWVLGVLVSWIMVSMVCAPNESILLPVYIHRAVVAFMLQAIMVGMGLAWLVELIQDGPFRAIAAGMAAVSIAVAVPAAGMQVLAGDTALGAEYDLLQLLNEPGIGGGNRCTVIYYHVVGDVGVTNPQTLAPKHMFLDCSDPLECTKAASSGGCIFYMRNTQCFFRERRSAASGGGESLNRFCADFERNHVLKPVGEKEVNFHESYGVIENFPAKGVMGLYRVVGLK